MHNRIKMSTPREFTMNYNFKLVYTDIVHTIEISSNATLHDLFDEACAKFTPHINYDNYYIDYIVAGQDKGELASAIGIHNLYEPLWYEFGDRWKQVSFYVRPMDRNDDLFHRMDNYNVVPLEEVAVQSQETETQIPETNIHASDTLGVVLPPPPGLTRQVDREIFI